MCNNPYLLSVERVFKLFPLNTPKSMEQIIADLGDEVFSLTLDGEPLYRFITNMTKEGSLKKKGKEYLITQQGLDTLKELEDWIASYDTQPKKVRA